MRRASNQRWRLCAAVVLCALLAVPLWMYSGAALSALAQWSGYRLDFTAPYAAAHMIATGSGAHIYDLRAIADAETALTGHPVGGSGVLGYYNPPFFALLLTPLAALSIERAYEVWTAINLVLVAVNVWMVWRVARPLPTAWRVGLSLVFVTFFPVIYGLLLGQFSLILITSWTGAFLLLRSGHQRWAGAALAPLLIKPELLVPVVLFLVLKRRWSVLQTLAPLTALAVALSVAVVGVSASFAYPGFLLSSTRWQEAGVATNVMFNWNGIFAMFWSRPAAVPLAALAIALMSVATLGVAWHAWRGKVDPQSPRFATQWAVLSVATVLVDPHLYLQDTALLMLPAVSLLAATPRQDRGVVVAALLGGWALLSMGVYPNEHLGINLFALYIVAAGSALVLWILRSPRPEVAAQEIV